MRIDEAPYDRPLAIVVPMHDGSGGKEVRHTIYRRVPGEARFYPDRNVPVVRLRTTQGEPGSAPRYDTGAIDVLTELPHMQTVEHAIRALIAKEGGDGH